MEHPWGPILSNLSKPKIVLFFTNLSTKLYLVRWTIVKYNEVSLLVVLVTHTYDTQHHTRYHMADRRRKNFVEQRRFCDQVDDFVGGT